MSEQMTETMPETSGEIAVTKHRTKDPKKSGYKIPLSDIIREVKQCRSLSRAAKVLGCHHTNISARLQRAGIDYEQWLEFTSAKDTIYEAVQSRILSNISAQDLEKAPLGTKILAVCQLEDKVRLNQGKSTNNVSIYDHIVSGANQDE